MAFARACRAALPLLLTALAGQRADAHPHVWVLYALNLEMERGAAVAIDAEWMFTNGFQALLPVDLSRYPKNGALSPQDTEALRRTAFQSLKDVGYFTHAYVQGRAVPLGEPQRFSVAMRDGKLVYTFRMALTQPVDPSRTPLELGVWDDEFFVDFEMKKDGVRTSGIKPAGTRAACRVFYTPDANHAVYYGTYAPMSATVAC
ncbi:DUF1007 family protein [Burkholderia alba]|uniref:DUF1007 family protein n=1 Tax=Burkholderia alba TaxID=2683677 RepID=UPI002B06107D|nr:DUF1007 family protein [Burkholderia alba]